MKKSRFIIFGAILVVAIAIFLFRINSSKTNTNKIETAKVEQKNVIETISSSGKTKANAEANLKFQIAGKLAWVGVKEGDSVYKNQTIASLDIAELQKNLDKALRDYSKERNDFDQDKIDTYRDVFITNTFRRILEKNQWDLEKAVMDVELKDIALKNAYLITPISGIVTHIDNPIAGVNISITSVFTVVDPQTIVFTANVDEVDVGKLKLGQTTQINLDAYPEKTFPGKISKIAYAAEISAGGATVFPVEISFNDTQDLRIGLNGDVTIDLHQVNGALSIPNDAIKETGNNKYVVKKVGKDFIKQTVKTGISSDNDTEITEGLKINDEVVIKDFQLLPKSLQVQ